MGFETAVREMHGMRAELVERLKTLEAESQSIVSNIATLDRAILMFDPSHQPATAAGGRRRDPKRSFKPVPFVRREMTALIGQILRGADGPMSSADIAAAIAERKGVAHAEKEARAWLTSRVSIALNGLERSQVVMGLRTEGERAVRWQAVR